VIKSEAGAAKKPKPNYSVLFTITSGGDKSASQANQILKDYRPEAKRLDKLDELIVYLDARRPFIPNYKEPRQQRQFISSGHAEKANDLIVARRQKQWGMHWSLETSPGLASLKNLTLNRGWDLYWSDRQALPLAVTPT